MCNCNVCVCVCVCVWTWLFGCYICWPFILRHLNNVEECLKWGSIFLLILFHLQMFLCIHTEEMGVWWEMYLERITLMWSWQFNFLGIYSKLWYGNTTYYSVWAIQTKIYLFFDIFFFLGGGGGNPLSIYETAGTKTDKQLWSQGTQKSKVLK